VGQECVLQLNAGEAAGTIWWSDLQLRPETAEEAADRDTQTEATALNGRWPLADYKRYEGVSSVRVRYLIAPLRFANTRDKFVEKKEYFNRLFSNEWPGMGHYWRSVSYGKVRVEGEAVDWIDLPGNWEDYCDTENGVKVFNRQKLADAVATRYSMKNFDAIALFPNIRDERMNATPMMVKMQGKTFPGIYVPDYGISVQVCAHEMGHAFGFDHTFGVRHGDGRWDVMGLGGSWGNRHLRFGAIPSDVNAYHKMRVGWISEAQTLRIEPGMEKEFHLERLSEPTREGYLTAVIKPANAGRFFWTLEARMRSGYDMGSVPAEGVVCFQCDPDRIDPTVTIARLTAVSTVVDNDNNGNVKNEGTAAWQAGKTYVNTQYQFSVTVVSRDATGWTVRVKVDP
jgi:M6 family metalloprotease-like protein